MVDIRVKTNIWLPAFVLAVLTLLIPSFGQAAIIDTFDDPSPVVPGVHTYSFGDVNPFSNTVTGSAGVFQGDRNYTVTEDPGSPPANFSLGSSGSIGDGSIVFFTGIDPVVGVLNYPDTGSFTTNQDLTALGNQFDFTFQFLNDGDDPGFNGVKVVIDVFTTSGTLTTGQVVLGPGFPPASGPQTFSVPFSSFSGPGDFSQTTGIRITFNPNEDTNLDFQLNQIEITPEPTSLIIWGVVGAASAGVWYTRRKKKRHLIT